MSVSEFLPPNPEVDAVVGGGGGGVCASTAPHVYICSLHQCSATHHSVFLGAIFHLLSGATAIIVLTVLLLLYGITISVGIEGDVMVHNYTSMKKRIVRTSSKMQLLFKIYIEKVFTLTLPPPPHHPTPPPHQNTHIQVGISSLVRATVSGCTVHVRVVQFALTLTGSEWTCPSACLDQGIFLAEVSDRTEVSLA